MSDGIRSGVNWMRLKRDVEDLAMRADHERLGQPGHADEQAVAAGEDGGEDLLDHLGLADDDPAELLDHLGAGLGELGQVFADAVGGHRELLAAGLVRSTGPFYPPGTFAAFSAFRA